MKSFEAERGMGMTEAEARDFLSGSKSTLLLGTTDADGAPSIHPVWFYFDSDKTKLYVYTNATSRKAQNIRKSAGVYFDVDHDVWPYKGVKGKGRAKIRADTNEALSHTEKILTKYLKSGHPLIDATLGGVKTGRVAVIEISPEYFSSWDYGKLEEGTRNGMRDAVAP